MTHNFAFMGTVVKDLILQYPDHKVIRFKSNKCAALYKSKKVFTFWKKNFFRNKKAHCNLLWSCRTWERPS